MKLFVRISATVVTAGILLCTAAADEAQPPFQVSFASASGSAWSASWEGVAIMTYFMQVSTDLADWSYLPDMKSGEGVHTASGMNTDVPKFFFRLKYTDLDPADLAGDGIPALFKVATLGVDPFLKATSDASGNGLPDAWEIFHFGAVNVALSGTISQLDGLTNKEKADLGLDPDVNYSASAQRAQYQYDAAGRLTEVVAPLVDATFSPDAEGNILSTN